MERVSAGRFCPLCGAPVEVGTGRWQRVEGMTMGQSVQLMGAGGVFSEFSSGRRGKARVEYVRRAPAGTVASREAVRVPLEQGLVTGGLGLAVGLPVGWWAGGLGLAVVGGCAGLAGGFGGLWVWGLVDQKRALWVVERITRTDLDGDGSVGRPDPPVYLSSFRKKRDEVEGEVEDEGLGPNAVLANDLVEFVRRGRTLGYGIRDWKGARMRSGTKITDGVWREWTGWLKGAGILESDQGGTRLVVSLGDAVRAISTGGG